MGAKGQKRKPISVKHHHQPRRRYCLLSILSCTLKCVSRWHKMPFLKDWTQHTSWCWSNSDGSRVQLSSDLKPLAYGLPFYFYIQLKRYCIGFFFSHLMFFFHSFILSSSSRHCWQAWAKGRPFVTRRLLNASSPPTPLPLGWHYNENYRPGDFLMRL